MIDIKDKKDCCGCSACVQKCPKQCITLKADNEGFLYPLVDKQVCIDCNLCEKVCPVLNQASNKKPLRVYAAKNNDTKIINRSSSGGIFYLLAEKILAENGIVIGATFNENWEVCHTYINKQEDINKLQGSKYVQSKIGNTYKDAEVFLKDGKKVLFTGTPCQIAGLHKFLRKEYENLYCVDVICHGAPSPGVWNDYLNTLVKQPKSVAGKNTFLGFQRGKPVISHISFRDKSVDWRRYSFIIRGYFVSKTEQKSVLSSTNDIIFNESHTQNLFMRGFLNNLYLRPSCYNCPARNGRSGSDILLGDFWGILRRYPDFYDSKGVSLVLTYTEKGKNLFDSLNCSKINATYDDALDSNINIEENETMPYNRDNFWKAYSEKGVKCIDKYCKQLEPSRFSIYLNIIKYKINKMLNR